MDLFLDNWGKFLSGLGVFITAIISLLRYRETIPRIAKVADGNKEIYNIIHGITNDIETIKHCTIIEYTNGGGIPEVGKPLYLKGLFSTDETVEKLYSEKTLLTQPTLSLVTDVITKGSGYMLPEEFKDSLVSLWCEKNGVKRVCQHLIGLDTNKRVLALVLNKTENQALNSTQLLQIIQATKKIRQLINHDRPIWRKIVNL